MRLVQWLAMCLVISGTWVRFPGPPIIPILFFLTLSCAAFKRKHIIHLIQESAKCPSVQIQGPRSEEHHAQESTALHSIPKVNVAEASMGHNSNQTPSNSSPHPPWVYSSLFFYFVIFIFFICLILFLINKLTN